MPDQSPERALERLLFEGKLDRRRFLGRAGGSALALSGLSAVLAACGGVEGEAEKNASTNASKPATANHPKTAIGTWVFANWPLYMDKKLLKDFDKEYGGKVRYVEEINDNFEFFGKVRQQLTQGKPIGRDIVTLTDYMAARWVRNGYTEPLDKKNIPNAKNLVKNLQSINYDKDRSYTLPYQSGGVGIGYNKKKTGREIKSINDLFDPKFKGRVSMLQEPYDSAGLVMLSQGVDASKANIDQILKAIEKIQEENDKGQIRRFTGNDYSTDLTKGNLWLCVAYSGDLVQLQADNPDLDFVYPEEGAMLFTDNMMIPKGAAHPYAAETMMNYLYEPKVAAKLAEYVNYISPVDGIKEFAPDIADNPLIFPPDDVVQRLHAYPALSPADERRMQEAMAQVTGA
ncbi:MAG: spermidine/putrescine ABC transporter substrate-binding protein [Solirubrobacterales bacterium]|nr:spermidine/putrescine ABC transporter substrate-binding protein [Solirubrobacterales bacterium]